MGLLQRRRERDIFVQKGKDLNWRLNKYIGKAEQPGGNHENNSNSPRFGSSNVEARTARRYVVLKSQNPTFVTFYNILKCITRGRLASHQSSNTYYHLQNSFYQFKSRKYFYWSFDWLIFLYKQSHYRSSILEGTTTKSILLKQGA